MGGDRSIKIAPAFEIRTTTGHQQHANSCTPRRASNWWLQTGRRRETRSCRSWCNLICPSSSSSASNWIRNLIRELMRPNALDTQLRLCATSWSSKLARLSTPVRQRPGIMRFASPISISAITASANASSTVSRHYWSKPWPG